jgi:hypothetical protein
MTNIFSRHLRDAHFPKPIPVYINKNSEPDYEVGETCYSYANCYVNASWLALCHPHLKVVIGSLGTAGHFDYGGKNWTYEDFAKKPTDSHAWAEDSDGNIYDFIFPCYAESARLWGWEPQFATEWEIKGISKKDLLEDGLEYIPVPDQQTHTLIKEKVIKKYKKAGCANRIQMLQNKL